jgi:hypothetical protein
MTFISSLAARRSASVPLLNKSSNFASCMILSSSNISSRVFNVYNFRLARRVTFCSEERIAWISLSSTCGMRKPLLFNKLCINLIFPKSPQRLERSHSATHHLANIFKTNSCVLSCRNYKFNIANNLRPVDLVGIDIQGY